MNGGYVMVDYEHNSDAFAAVCRMAARWSDRRVTGIIGVPGDRDDSVIEQAGRVAGRGFHRVIIKEDHDLRGREKGGLSGATSAKDRARLSLPLRESLLSSIAETSDTSE